MLDQTIISTSVLKKQHINPELEIAPNQCANYFLVVTKPSAQLWKSFIKKHPLTKIKKWKKSKLHVRQPIYRRCRGRDAAACWGKKKKKKKKYVVDTGLYTQFPGSQTNVNVCVSSTNCSRFWKMFGLARVSVRSNILFPSLWHFTAVKSAVR